MRILIDQSGYHLLNLGDIAMLQAAVARLHRAWPDARLEVISHAPERLERYCPLAQPATWINDGDPTMGRPSARVRAGLVQIHKALTPYVALRPVLRRRAGGGRQPNGLLSAIAGADVVVGAGGGYINDSFWWHGAAVLSVLDLAQRLGKPTALFGQGLGPLAHRAVRRQARRVLPRVKLIGLREGVTGVPLLHSLGVDPDMVLVTGDDAIEVIGIPAGGGVTGRAIGLNLRVSSYSGVSDRGARTLVQAVEAFARKNATRIVGLPVSRFPRDSDLSSIRSTLGPAADEAVLQDLETPESLVDAVQDCRVVVTGSYHAAVFALTRGIPAICCSSSAYYDQKFSGLAAQFPGCSIVRLDDPELGSTVEHALESAWEGADSVHPRALEAAQEQLALGRAAYRRFKDIVDTEVGNG